jgi:hypothetical protein
MQKKLYVLLRKEFDARYNTAQGVHAASEFAIEFPDLFKDWGNKTTVVLGVRFPRGLRKWMEILKARGKLYTVFYEDDQEGQPTGIACYDTGEIFKDLPLL